MPLRAGRVPFLFFLVLFPMHAFVDEMGPAGTEESATNEDFVLAPFPVSWLLSRWR